MNRPFATETLALAIAAALSGVRAVPQAPTAPAIVRVGLEGPGCSGAVSSAACTLLIDADGPLPAPSSGALTNPARIYLDFSGVRAKTSGTPRADGSRPGVRVALHSTVPLVTRVVLDLIAPATYTVDGAHLAQGHVRVQLTGAPGAKAPAGGNRRTAASPSAPPTTVGRTPRRYGDRIDATLEAIESVRADLSHLDHYTMPTADALRTDLARISATRNALADIKPPAALAASHAQLVSACNLAATALAAAARDPDGKVAGDTASAAAGALILLDRARAGLSSSR